MGKYVYVTGNGKGAGQLGHLCSLISTVARIMAVDAVSKFEESSLSM